MRILFRDEDLLVVDKPAGLSVLPEGWDKDAPHLANILGEQFGKVWVVHRIDKSTSGVMVFALTAEAHRHLNIQFEKREVGKVYHAILVGAPAWGEKTAKFPLRVNVGHKHRTMVDDWRGVRSETRFKVRERWQAGALVEAVPLTGRTHQIRVHAYALGHPLLGDVLYSAPETGLISRAALHAHTLSFTHPQTGKMTAFHADYPDDFQQALGSLRSR